MTKPAVFTVHEAKTQLSRLLVRVEAGEEIVIARGAVPVARLVALPVTGGRRFGALGAAAALPDAFFFAPLPADELDAWDE
jgi:prevent-host-death family protein